MLEKPEMIARAVVARLNEQGGQFRIPLADKEKDWESKRLMEYLVDTIEPTPLDDEVRIEPGPDGLRVTAAPHPERKPYAHLWEGGRFFVIQEEERMRPMTREEVLSAPPDEDVVRRLLDEQRENSRRSIPEGGLFWMRIEPSEPLTLDLDRLLETDLLIDPTATRNRRVGFNFTAAFVLGGLEPGPVMDGKGRHAIRIGREDQFELTLEARGGVSMTAPLKSFSAAGATPPELGRLLWPFDLLELPVSVFRLLDAIHSRSDLWPRAVPPSTRFWAHLALYGLQGWHLRPGSPGKWGYRPPAAARFEEMDFILERPLVFRLAELREPDNCGYRLVSRIYESFGFPDSAIPGEFDRKLRRLVLPE
jgi:hypothetical protein